MAGQKKGRSSVVFRLFKSGCQWRMLPKEFPKWRTCHDDFTVWSEKINNQEGRESRSPALPPVRTRRAQLRQRAHDKYPSPHYGF